MHDIVFQVTYDQLQVGLVVDNQWVIKLSEDKQSICKHNVLIIQQILRAAQLTLADIRCIVVNQGPAPFTSLRIGITTVNGIAFATGTRLIGVSALHAFSCAYAHTAYQTVVLLNAFNQDLYYALCLADGTYAIGCAAKERVAEQLLAYQQKSEIRIVGNGYDIMAPYMQQTHGITVDKADTFLPYPTLEMIYAYAQTSIAHEQYKAELLPIYLKQFAYKPSC